MIRRQPIGGTSQREGTEYKEKYPKTTLSQEVIMESTKKIDNFNNLDTIETDWLT